MGPLKQVKIIEIAGIGPGPFAGMMLADMGAEVIRIERPGGNILQAVPEYDFLNRGKRCMAVNLKDPDGLAVVLDLIADADALLEGYRPGVAEKLGIGPEVCLNRNSKLVYGRVTGWGQEGPNAHMAGHDINYIAVSGALDAIGRAGDKPAIPLNLVGDNGGGGLMLAYGMVCALLEAKVSGQGQVVDAAMVDGSLALMATIFGVHQSGYWSAQRGTNLLDSGAPFYDTYETADGKYLSVGSVEPQFYQALLQGLGLLDEDLPEQMDAAGWPQLRQRFTEVIKSKTRHQWTVIFDGTDACVAPVLSMAEVHGYPHNQQRDNIINVDGAMQPAPAPRFSRTEPAVAFGPAAIGQHTQELLLEMGYDKEAIERLMAHGSVA